MDIGGRGGAGCGIGERIIQPDSGRGMREGIGEKVNSMSFEDREVSRIRRSIVQYVSCKLVVNSGSHFTLMPHDTWTSNIDHCCIYRHI